MTEWISVKDKLPYFEELGVSDSVLICFHRKCLSCYGIDSDNRKIGNNISVGYYSVVDEIKSWNLCEPLAKDYLPHDHEEQIKVTHWMPLPELPK